MRLAWFVPGPDCFAGRSLCRGKVLHPITPADRGFEGPLVSGKMQKPRQIRGFCTRVCIRSPLLCPVELRARGGPIGPLLVEYPGNWPSAPATAAATNCRFCWRTSWRPDSVSCRSVLRLRVPRPGAEPGRAGGRRAAAAQPLQLLSSPGPHQLHLVSLRHLPRRRHRPRPAGADGGTGPAGKYRLPRAEPGGPMCRRNIRRRLARLEADQEPERPLTGIVPPDWRNCWPRSPAVSAGRLPRRTTRALPGASVPAPRLASRWCGSSTTPTTCGTPGGGGSRTLPRRRPRRQWPQRQGARLNRFPMPATAHPPPGECVR